MHQGVLFMKRKVFAVVGTVLVLAAILCFFFLRDTDEKRIRGTLDELCRIGSKSTGENPALGALKANRADKVFAPRCSFNFRINSFDGVYTPTEIGANILRIQTLFKWIKLSTSDLQIEIDGDKGKIFFTGEFSGVAKHGSGSPHNDVRDIEADLVKNSENEWKFTRMTIRKVLEK